MRNNNTLVYITINFTACFHPNLSFKLWLTSIRTEWAGVLLINYCSLLSVLSKKIYITTTSIVKYFKIFFYRKKPNICRIHIRGLYKIKYDLFI